MAFRFRWPPWRSAAGLALVAAMSLAGVARAQDARATLPGLWLIEPGYYDMFADSGLDVAAFPVLFLAADGRFRLIRLRPICDPLDETGALIERNQKPAQWLATCQRDRAEAEAIGLAANALPAASGTWSILADGRIRFVPLTVAPTPKLFAGLLPAFRTAMSAGKLERIGPPPPPAEAAAQSRRLAAQARRIDTFYGTFYVFDGAPARFALEGDTLRLAGDGADDALVYRRAAPGPTAAAMHVLLALGQSAAAYFRCTHDRLRAAWSGDTPPAGDLGALVALATEIYEFDKRQEESLALAAAGKADEAARMFGAAEFAAVRALGERLNAHPAGAAAKARKFGAWLGCPARDDW